GFVGDVLSVLLLFGVETVALLAAIRASLPISPRPSFAVLLGLVPLGILLARPPQLSYSARLWRAGVFARYSGPDPSAAELAKVVEAAATPAEQRLAAGFWKAYGSGAPPPLPTPAPTAVTPTPAPSPTNP